MHGRTVRLYLVDGSPTGILTAEIMNWTGHVLVVPRSRLGEALRREEANRTGVYFLVGSDYDQLTKPRVYVGEGDSVAERLKLHARDSAKDFWTRACIVTSKDANLTKAHVRYLESRFVSIANAADRASLANGNEPSLKGLPESDLADMEFFISQVQVVLPVVGFDFLRAKASASEGVSSAAASGEDANRGVRVFLSSSKHGYEAKGIELDGELTVLKGSRATAKADFATNIYAPLREQLIRDGRLARTADPNFLEFVDDVSFASPSAAAAVIHNRNANGRTDWRLSNGQTLKEWQDNQLK